MMYPCKKCLSKQWKFSKQEAWMTAECLICGNSVTWEVIDSPRVEKVGDKCKCGSEVIYQDCKPKKKQLRRAYFYTGYFYCPACKKIYYSDEFKVVNQDICEKNIQESIKYAQGVIG